MTVKRTLDPQFDLFVPFVAHLPLRDQRETMERPFLSLAKRKRLQPIHYVSPDGSIYVDVFPNPEFGMATIWDADILIWAASTLNAMKKAGSNDLAPTNERHFFVA
jgi:plasmid replication initiation protein